VVLLDDGLALKGPLRPDPELLTVVIRRVMTLNEGFGNGHASYPPPPSG